MHIKTGTWEASSTVCEPDALYDTAALVSPPNPEPHIRNRRLSPGSGECGGGGGGGNRVRGKPETPPPEHGPASGRDAEHRAHPKGRALRKVPEGARAARARRGERERWAGDGLSLLKPPPAFPVQDSPAKLQPAVSYASKVKSGGAGGGAEDPPAIGVLLQNQWGLSFISEGPQAQNGPTFGGPPCSPVDPIDETPAPETHTQTPPPVTPPLPISQCREEIDSSGELLLGCRHLVEALRYHTQEWGALDSKQKRGSATIIWYKNSAEQPA
ncbi:SKI family transcriptional corepressor 1 isoform X2 [Anguilla rostrata]|uniref:SKI family transcriptional corepressor 1 n=1 Tax=Anguilla anguilla TaxID=7936 RepID=UPI0015A8809B|nr:SKI family transcriptional corepressor 1 [Anguilla anguilla]